MLHEARVCRKLRCELTNIHLDENIDYNNDMAIMVKMAKSVVYGWLTRGISSECCELFRNKLDFNIDNRRKR